MFRLFSKSVAPVAARSLASQASAIKPDSTGLMLKAMNFEAAPKKGNDGLISARTFTVSNNYPVNAEAYAFMPFVHPKAPHEQALVNGVGLVGMKALQFLADGEDLELNGPNGAINFLESLEAGNGLAKLKANNPVAFDKIEKLQKLVEIVAPKKGIHFNPKPHGFEQQFRPAGP